MSSSHINGTWRIVRRGLLSSLGVLVAFAASTSCSHAAPAAPIASLSAKPGFAFTAQTVAGAARPLPVAGARATLLIFTLHDCPVCNRYAPEINRICDKYKSAGVAAFTVYEERDLTPAQAKNHAALYALKTGLLYDPAHTLARRVGAETAPEAVLLSPSGDVYYHGRIDDSFRHFGMSAGAPTKRDLRAAIDSLLSGAEGPLPSMPVVGCAIPRD